MFTSLLMIINYYLSLYAKLVNMSSSCILCVKFKSDHLFLKLYLVSRLLFFIPSVNKITHVHLYFIKRSNLKVTFISKTPISYSLLCQEQQLIKIFSILLTSGKCSLIRGLLLTVHTIHTYIVSKPYCASLFTNPPTSL